jgi:glycosyltransferase involved in cell wall biosynthesis
LLSIDAVYSDLDRRVARRLRNLPQVGAVYAFDGGAFDTFQSAKTSGVTCIYEHPIAYSRYVRQLHQEEADRLPEWRPTLLALRDSEAKIGKKDAELAAADVVVVASEFARRSLASAANIAAAIHVVPYGAPAVIETIRPNESQNLRTIFVGALTQAKGLSYLLDAIESLTPHAELTIVGQRVSRQIPAQTSLDRHRWIPSLSHHALLAEISRHDVLILPSLHEGFGLVILEAMSQGVPVITTPNTAGPDVIEDQVDGFIVPVRSADAIRDRLDLLIRDRDLLQGMKEAARAKAARLSWSLYRQRIAELAREVIAN